jgi:RNA polymerase sigma-70 factor, ECF subfamily
VGIDGEPRNVPGLVDHLFRRSAGQLVSTLTGILGPAYLDLAEEVVQDAMLRALQVWSVQGVPDHPKGWLFQVARNQAFDRLRRQTNLVSKLEQFPLVPDSAQPEHGDGPIRDHELRMIFMCCHPVLSPASRVALTLKIVGGFSVGEIARAFLTTGPTVAQRLVRAKRLLREREVPLELPALHEITDRLDSVLEVIYLMFNEGYGACSGDDLIRLDLCHEAIRLAEHLIEDARTMRPATHALMALMLFQSARLPARLNADGSLVVLADQDRSRWDQGMVARGFRHLERAARGTRMSQYHLEAAIAAEHAAASCHADTDWSRLVGWYDQLYDLTESPVVALNRAVAVSMRDGPEAGLAALAAIPPNDTLKRYYLFPATLGELHARLGNHVQAARQFAQALELECSVPEQQFLAKKLDESTKAMSRAEEPERIGPIGSSLTGGRNPSHLA